MMAENNNGNMTRYAMVFGTYMGLFWIAKFILVPIGITTPFLLLLFFCLTLCVPFLGYYYTKMYRDKVCGGQISFFHAWTFNLFMFICASMLTAVAHYVYFAFIDQGYLIGVCKDMLNTIETSNMPGTEAYVAQVKESIDVLEALTPTDIILQLLVNNVYNCALLSIIIALIAKRHAKQTTMLQGQ